MFDNSSGTLDQDRFDSYFRWTPYLESREEDMSLVALVQVTPDTIAEYRATVLPPDDQPAVGFYVLYVDSDGEPTVFAYADDQTAATADYAEAVEVDFR